MSEVRVGYVSSIDYENGLCEIHYPDRDDTVTEMVPFLSNREYRTPEVEDMVLVLHPGDSPEDAVVMGTIWNEKIKPAEGKKGIYRKEFSNKDGQAYRKFDANAKELTDHVDGKYILEAKSLEIKVGGATVTISESGAVTVNSPAGITIKAAGTLEEFSLEKNITGMRLKARATGNLSTTNLKLDSQLKQQAEYQKPTTPGGGSGSGNTPDPKPNPDEGDEEAPDPTV